MEPQKSFTPHGAPIRNAKLLPVQPPGQVIGRNRELGSMHVTLKVGTSVLLSGSSGIGKTALAAVMATAYTASNPGGVLWFNVIEDNFDLLLARVGRAYGVNALSVPGEDSANSAAIVRALLEKNRPLIVFDGLIDLDAARDFIRQCATGIPVILTNELYGAGPWTPISLEPLSQADSQTLFRYYSGMQDAAASEDIEGLCKFLDGIPVSIELAARQVVVDDQTPAELMTQLPSSAGQDSQYMMMSVVFKKLPPPVQAMLLVLAATPFGTATAELIGGLSNVPAVNIIPLMRQLVTRAIAREFVTYGQFAYVLQDCAQTYTRNWLTQYQRLQPTENRTLQAVLSYAERHAHNNPGDHDRLAAEMLNIVGVTAFATETGQANSVRLLVTLLTQRTGDFVSHRGFQPEIDQIMKLSTLLNLAPTESYGQPVPGPAGISFTEPPPDAEATPVSPRVPLTPKPLAHDVQPTKVTQPIPTLSLDMTQPASPVDAFLASETVTAAPIEEPPVDMDKTPLDQPAEPVLTADKTPIAEPPMGTEKTPLPEPTEPIAEPPVSPEDTDKPTPLSLPSLQGQLDDARAAGDTRTQATISQALGQYYVEQNNRAEALSYYREALDAYETLQDNDGILVTLDALAGLTAQADDVENALVYAARGVNLAQQIGERDRLGRLQTRLGDVRLALGDLPAAVETYTQAAETLRATENWLAIGMVMAKLGSAYLEQGKTQESIMMLEQSLVIFRKERRTDYEMRTLGTLGTAYAQVKQVSKAQEYYEQALAMARAEGNRAVEAEQLPALAHLREVQNDPAGAILYYRQALHMAYQANLLDLQAECTFELGRLLVDDTRTLKQAVQLLHESDDLVPNNEAKRLLNRAEKRIERTAAAGIELPSAEGSNRGYAAAAYPSAAIPG